jgi:biopolymer transport protein ExbD
MSVRLDHGEDSLDELHEINVTPFIDVMLVLLIIFMVAAPLITVDRTMSLAASGQKDAQPRQDKPIEVKVKPDLTVMVDDRPVPRDTLGRTLLDATHGDKDAQIVVTADKTTPYGEVLELMIQMREAGFKVVGFRTRRENLPPL